MNKSSAPEPAGRGYSDAVDRTRSYDEQVPVRDLAAVVRTVWIQRAGSRPALQRHLPTGGVELQVPLGRAPRLIGPLTRPATDILMPGTTIVGLRFWPGAAAPFLRVPAHELVDQVVPFDDVATTSSELGRSLRETSDADDVLRLLQGGLLRHQGRTRGPDPLTAEAVQRLMPWQPTSIQSLTDDLSISESQLRRRFLSEVGLGPKALQRTLRLQGFLALAQASDRADRVMDLAAQLAYADQAHLSRECSRLTGQTPGELLGEAGARCGCGHDHAASYRPFLARRARAGPVG